MKMRKISDKRIRLTHPTATKDLKKLIAKYPDYPITVLAGENANNSAYGWMYCASVGVGIGEILDCNTDYWDSYYVCTNRDDFETTACGIIWDDLNEELGRSPTDEEMESKWQEVKEAHEPYWKKCIAIYADN